MSSYLSENKSVFYNRSSIWLKSEETDLINYQNNSFPKKMLLSLNSSCNLRCKHCPRSHMKIEDIPDKKMSKEMIDHIAKKFFNNISAIQIGGNDLGEQMCSPHFSYFLEKVYEYPIDVDLITNGTLINKENAELLVSSLSRLLISIEGMYDNYELIRGFKWEKLEKNIDMLIEARDKLKRESPLIICLHICVMRNFRDDYFKFVEFAKKKKIDFIDTRNFIPFDKEECDQSFLYFEKEHNSFFKKLSKHAKKHGVNIVCPQPIPTKKAEQNIFKRASCSLPFEVFGMRADGKIGPCCDYRFDLGFFSTDHNNIEDDWSSENFNKLRETVNSTNPPPPCKPCEVINHNIFAYRPSFTETVSEENANNIKHKKHRLRETIILLKGGNFKILLQKIYGLLIRIPVLGRMINILFLIYKLPRLDDKIEETYCKMPEIQSYLSSNKDLLSKVTDFDRHLIFTRKRLQFIRKEIFYEIKYNSSGSNKIDKTVISPKIISTEKVEKNTGNLKLNIGCGHMPMNGYINVDLREIPNVDVVAPADKLPFDDGTVQEIFSSHLIEHFTQEEIKRNILPHWFKLLKTGGTFKAIYPDWEKMIFEYTESNYSFEKLREVTFGAQEYNGDFHYNMFTKESLTRILSEIGFKNISFPVEGRINHDCYESEVIAFKE